MSGGFFRGTSADQDTRFSNKQAKLLKSQKFPPELDHLVDMRKVNMEVIKPWITRRVTELLGFEDEVLINFIHGLLDAKEVNGKEVQIQITGFMEKNTGKFMKELWTLLLSAQQTASGVPQQLLDAKLEDLQKKNMENDRIASEIQRKKDRGSDREIEPERLKKMDDGFDSKETGANVEWVSKVRDGENYPQDGNGIDERNGVKARKRGSRSPYSPEQSTFSHRLPPSRSISRSNSHSRSHSGRRSRSVSGSPSGSRGRSLSRERKYRSPRRLSISPRWRRSPWRTPSPRRRPSYSSRRSRSRSLQRSPTSVRRIVRPPLYHRSPSPSRRRRSPSPVRRRRSPSPVRGRRSPSPMRRRRSPSPVRRRRSPSPVRRRRSPSPERRRRSPSPIRRRRSPSPIQRRRSPSPVRRRSPLHLNRRSYSPSQYGSPSPGQGRYLKSPPLRRSPLRNRSPVSGRMRLSRPPRQRSASIDVWSSQSPGRRTSRSPRRKSSRSQRSSVRSSRDRTRNNLSPELRQRPGSVRSPLTDEEEYQVKNKPQASLSSSEMSPGPSRSPRVKKLGVSENRSPFKSPERPTGEKLTHERRLSPPQKHREQKPKHDSPETSENEETNNSRSYSNQKSKSLAKESVYQSPGHKRKVSPAKVLTEENSCGRTDIQPKSETFDHHDKTQARKGGLEGRSDKPSQQKSPMSKGSLFSGRLHSTSTIDIKLFDEKGRHRSNHANDSDGHRKSEAMLDSAGKTDNVNSTAIKSSYSEESNKHKSEEKNRRKHKRSERKELESDEGYSSDSELEDKDAKRRKKEERKLRKEEKRRKREERRRRRHERRAEKLKTKNKRDESSDDDEVVRRDSHQSDEEPPYEQKKLEIELRNKALESFKAKKGFGH